MTILTFLVDEAGDLWNADSTDFHHRLGVRNPDFDVAAFAVKNFGWVEIAYGTRRMTVRLRPATAEPNAVKFLKDVLKGTDKPEVLLTSWHESWKKEKFSSPGAALARLEALLAPTHIRQNARFGASRVPIEQIFRDKQLSLIEHFQMWRSKGATTELPDAIRLAVTAREGRTGLIERSDVYDSYVTRHVGVALRFHNDESRRRLIGRDFRNAPDPDYATWCGLAYGSAIFENEPIVEDVLAHVRGTNGMLLTMNYRRLLTNFRTPKGANLVMVSSLLIPQRQAAA
ncbi:MAG: hypothetical protein HYR63_04510 [Proteobacteria bacterium]|nr:hypothetical protein [Pseudomonadota bacterium]MBI3499627.1 hypothetical protein [Pseudomonadota bacterium]